MWDIFRSITKCFACNGAGKRQLWENQGRWGKWVILTCSKCQGSGREICRLCNKTLCDTEIDRCASCRETFSFGTGVIYNYYYNALLSAMYLSPADIEDLRIIAQENGQYAHRNFYTRLQQNRLVVAVKNENDYGYRFELTELGREAIKLDIDN